MLVLTRKHNQSIMIGDNIEIMIVEIKGDQVKVGIRAPKSVSIYRAEVYNEIVSENKLATKSEINKIDEIEKIIKKNN